VRDLISKNNLLLVIPLMGGVTSFLSLILSVEVALAEDASSTTTRISPTQVNPSFQATDAALDWMTEHQAVPPIKIAQVLTDGSTTNGLTTDLSTQVVDPAMQIQDVPLAVPPVSQLEPTLADDGVFKPEAIAPPSPNQKFDPSSNSLEQVTSVTQLSDAKPTDWAYQALQSLVEKYGCIVGYPDSTFRGNRAATRFELAAALNACLDVISDRFASKEDLAMLRKLMEEFAAELATIRGRVDNLEARTAKLESTQFSTTTKLFGEAIFSFFDAFGGRAGDLTQPTVQYRASINLVSSFTGKDRLTLSMKTGNVPPLGVGFDVPGTFTNTTGTFIPGAEGTLAAQFAAIFDGKFALTTLEYQFPVGKQLRFYVATNSELFNQFTDTLNPFFDDNDGGRASVSAFGQRNPIYRLGGGPGAAVNFKPIEQLTLTAAYLTPFVQGGGDPQRGFLGSGYTALAQATWKPTKAFGVSATYIRGYFESGRFGFNNLGLYLTGTAVANTLAGQVSIVDAILPAQLQSPPVETNSYGAQFSFQPSPKFVINGWFGATDARVIGSGKGQILTYALNFGFPDLGRPGNMLGLVIGAEPYLSSFSGGNPQRFRVDIPWHIEAFYRYQITNNISVTPAVIWLTAPNQDNRNPDTVITVVRTTFNF
jgi:hypothetical protein